MYIETLSFEDWQGIHNRGEIITDPTLEQVEAALRDLDGSRRTLVTLQAPDGSYLAIGGGNDGRYVVSATISSGTMGGEEIFNLTSPYDAEQRSETLTRCWVVTGGQGADYPRRETVELERALHAARVYAERGVLDSSLPWEQVA